MSERSVEIIIEEEFNEQDKVEVQSDGRIDCKCGERVYPKTVAAFPRLIKFCFIVLGLILLIPLLLLCIPLVLCGDDCSGSNCKCGDLPNCKDCRCSCKGIDECLGECELVEDCTFADKCLSCLCDLCIERCLDQCCRECFKSSNCCGECHVVNWDCCCSISQICPKCGRTLDFN